MAQVTTSVTVSFGSGASSDSGQNAFSAEIDSREDGYNKGNTNFYPNDTVYILLYKGPNVGSVTQATSSGSVSQYTTATVEKKETFSMSNSRELRTSVPVAGNFSVTWYGTTQTLTQQGENLYVTATPITACGEVTYDAVAQVYALSGVSYPQAVVSFTGELLT